MRTIPPVPNDAVLVIYTKKGKKPLFHARVHSLATNKRAAYFSYDAAVGLTRCGGGTRTQMLDCARSVMQKRPKSLIQGELSDDLLLLLDATPKKAKTPEPVNAEEYCELCGIIHKGGKCPENKRHARRSLEVLNYFAHNGGEWIKGEKTLSPDMIEQNMSDLLCNFAHLCDLKGVSFGVVLRRAKGHYDAETVNRGRQQFEPEYWNPSTRP